MEVCSVLERSIMQKEFEKVFLNKYGFYELKNKPSVEERKKEFEEEYYQV